MLPRFKELFVASGINCPSLLQVKVKGAVPDGTTLKMTSEPGQTVWLGSGEMEVAGVTVTP